MVICWLIAWISVWIAAISWSDSSVVTAEPSKLMKLRPKDP
jgi:hypothetical protein